jgi:hypothetical protein
MWELEHVSASSAQLNYFFVTDRTVPSKLDEVMSFSVTQTAVIWVHANSGARLEARGRSWENEVREYDDARDGAKWRPFVAGLPLAACYARTLTEPVCPSRVLLTMLDSGNHALRDGELECNFLPAPHPWHQRLPARLLSSLLGESLRPSQPKHLDAVAGHKVPQAAQASVNSSEPVPAQQLLYSSHSPQHAIA